MWRLSFVVYLRGVTAYGTNCSCHCRAADPSSACSTLDRVGDLSHVHLVGRQRELAAVARLLDRARDGHGGQLLITGPPGAGRTALLHAAADLAHDRHIPVTWLTTSHADLATTGLATMGDGPRLLLVDDL